MNRSKFFLNEKNVFSLLILVFIIITLGLALILVKKPQIYQKKATTGTPASLSLISQTTTYPRSSTFFVDINLSTGGLNTSGTAVKIRFSPNYFQVLEVIPGKNLGQSQMYQNILRNTFDNSQGEILLDAGVSLPNPIYFNGPGIFGRIKFKIKENAPLGQSTISFYLSNPSQPSLLGDCDVIGAAENTGRDLLGQIKNLTISVSSGATSTPEPSPTSGSSPTPTRIPTPTLTPIPSPTVAPYSPILKLKINFFGIRNEPANPPGLDYKNQIVSVIIKKESPTTFIQRNIIFKATSTPNGFYYENSQDKFIPNIQPGIYTILIKGPKHLQKKFKDINLIAGEQTLDFSSERYLLAGGDLPLSPQNGGFSHLAQDGKVNALDYNFLVNNFNKTDTNSLKIGDLNLDGIINTGDTSVLATTLGEKIDEEN